MWGAAYSKGWGLKGKKGGSGLRQEKWKRKWLDGFDVSKREAHPRRGRTIRVGFRAKRLLQIEETKGRG